MVSPLETCSRRALLAMPMAFLSHGSSWCADRRGDILRRMEAVMGPLPAAPKVPLDVRITERTDHAAYTLQRLTYVSEARDRVSACLLIPQHRKGRLPAVLCLHQTTPLGKDEPAGLGGNPNLHYAGELAERGYVTLAPDYPNFGDYHVDPYSLGYASATMKGIFNHMRAVDLLVGLAEVDPQRIAAAGHSLGGHNALFLAAFDQRIRAVVTSCGFTSFRKYQGGDLTGWSHRGYMPRIASVYGKSPDRMPFDFDDVLRAIAPRPVFVNAPQHDDNFDASGVDDAVKAVTSDYQAQAAGGAIVVVHPDTAHEFPPVVREQAYWFLDRWLKLPAPGAELLDVRRVWDRGGHNAFTDLIRHRDGWFCVFREGQSHVSPDGVVRVLASSDAVEWSPVAVVAQPGRDLRDPKLSVAPDGRLMLLCAAVAREGVAHLQTMEAFSSDGHQWSVPEPVGEPDVWIWRVTWRDDVAYGVGYGSSGGHDFARLYRSKDGRRFDTLVPLLAGEGDPNETSLLFRPDGTALCLLRRDGANAQLGTARPPYTEWSFQNLGIRFGGPHMMALPDGRIIAAGRVHDGGVRTSLCLLDPDAATLTELLALPSGGDTSYPGLVYHRGLLYVSYYSSHQGRTAIYLARVRLLAGGQQPL